MMFGDACLITSLTLRMLGRIEHLLGQSVSISSSKQHVIVEFLDNTTLADALCDSLLPALAFIIDMNRRTGGFFGVNEALFSSAFACMVFSIIGAQPLTVVGITGLISLFNFTIYDIIKRYDASLYPQFLAWVSIWAAIFHWIFAIFNTCDYMRYVTDFSSQSFGAYVGIIYCSMPPNFARVSL